jgi:hypothetical protein
MTSAATPRAPKPSYLGLLNAIATAELRGHQYLSAWADTTTDPEVEQALRIVAAREGEHSFTFARRIVDLGFRVRSRQDTEDEAQRKEVVVSDISDLEKFEALGYADDRDRHAPDIHDDYFHDHSIDPVTGALIGRFVCEERDSGRLLDAAYQALKARQT